MGKKNAGLFSKLKSNNCSNNPPLDGSIYTDICKHPSQKTPISNFIIWSSV